MTDVLILGAGPAGSRAALEVRRREPSSRIALVGEEPHPFPNRILLSKEFLTADPPLERAVALPSEAFLRAGVDLRCGRRATRLDTDARTVELDDGERIAWGRCLVATGARPLALPIPGFALPGVHVLRSAADAAAIRDRARGAESAVVIGGGLLGAEVACALSIRGLRTSLLAREAWLWGHLAPEPVGRSAGAILARGGVRLLLERTVVAIRPDRHTLVVETAEGDALGCALVVAAVGVRPDLAFLSRPELLDVSGGIRANPLLETDAPGVWAAGDVASFQDPVYGGVRHRVEHWLHAQHQGRAAGAAMCGDARPYARVSSYDTRLFDVAVTAVGAPELADQWTEEEPFRDDSGGALGWRDGRVVAGYRLGGGRSEDLAARIAAEGAPA